MLFSRFQKRSRGWLGLLNYLIDLITFPLKRLFGLNAQSPLIISSYRGFGQKNRIILSGRILKNKFIISDQQGGHYRILRNNLNRFRSDEIPGAEINIQIGTYQFDKTTDPEGYFKLDYSLPTSLDTEGNTWFPYKVNLLKTPWQDAELSATGEILIPGQADFGIISDIDDTILDTGVTSFLKWQAIYRTLLLNAGSRKAIQTGSALYRALEVGNGVLKANRPFFYVSNGPWNLYDLLEEFLTSNDFPKGPILLRDFGIPYEERHPTYQGHKYEQIAQILQTYPNLPFLLIGDSGEKDLDIYLNIAKKFPGRVPAIYIRDVAHKKRADRINQVIALAPVEPEILLVKSFTDAAAHAVIRGWIDADFKL
ncbi:MAG: phosphatase [Saprospiraceae bacterium]|nr:MAG: phosphatase [Saprospiraceae bacterium]